MSRDTFILFNTKLTDDRYIRASSIHGVYYNSFTKAVTLDTVTGHIQLKQEEGSVGDVVQKIYENEIIEGC